MEIIIKHYHLEEFVQVQQCERQQLYMCIRKDNPGEAFEKGDKFDLLNSKDCKGPPLYGFKGVCFFSPRGIYDTTDKTSCF